MENELKPCPMRQRLTGQTFYMVGEGTLLICDTCPNRRLHDLEELEAEIGKMRDDVDVVDDFDDGLIIAYNNVLDLIRRKA